MQTVADILEPLAERIYDVAHDQKLFLRKPHMLEKADNTSVMLALDEVQYEIHLNIDPELTLIPYPQIEEALRDVEDACIYLSDNFKDPTAFQRIDVSEKIDEFD